MEIGWGDLTTNKLVCIDTEKRSFTWNTNRTEGASYHKDTLVKELQLFDHEMTPEGKEYFKNYLQKLSFRKKDYTKILPSNSSYDSAGIDFEQVKKEYSTHILKK